ncbi:MAG: hypothetical protein LYZ70_05645 [Nitrososphaerales archaeon]|nr:hypothetical protein [Nitrososphaerales archaeon]
MLARAVVSLSLGLFLIGAGAFQIPVVQTTIESFGTSRFALWLVLPFVAQSMDFAGAYAFYETSVAARLGYNINYLFASKERNQAIVALITNGDPYQYVFQSLLVGSLVVGLFFSSAYAETKRLKTKNLRRIVVLVPTAMYLIGLFSAVMAILTLRPT